MTASLLVKAFTPPEGWFPGGLEQAIPGRRYVPVPDDLLPVFMASAWASVQMRHYGTLAQLGADEGRHHQEEEMKILILLMNRIADARKILDRAFWSEANSTAIVVRYVDGKSELALSVEL